MSSPLRRPARLAPVVVAALLLAVPAGAQQRPIAAGTQRIQDLLFGSIVPGLATTVPPTDMARSGQFSITGNKYAQVEVTLGIPSALAEPGGASMPLAFTSSSGGYSESGTTTDMILLDPRVRFTVNLSKNGRGFVFLGGTLAPPATQRAGAYTATVTITVVYTGL